LIFGTTGSGKSTLANSLLNGPKSLERNKHGLIEIIDQLSVKFKIGHQVISETKAPNFHLISDGVFLVDGPGINDSNFKHEYANQ